MKDVPLTLNFYNCPVQSTRHSADPSLISLHLKIKIKLYIKHIPNEI